MRMLILYPEGKNPPEAIMWLALLPYQLDISGLNTWEQSSLFRIPLSRCWPSALWLPHIPTGLAFLGRLVWGAVSLRVGPRTCSCPSPRSFLTCLSFIMKGRTL